MKKKNKTTSVSVGIPAYNEGKNIKNVLLDVLSQKTEAWRLNEILVYCDGCSDDTVAKAKSVENKLVKVIVNHTRRGKTFRLQQMFSKFNSDVLVIVDADVKLADDNVITHLVETLSRDEKIMLVSGNVRPFPPTTFFQKAVYTTFNVFDKTRNAIKNGNNIFTCGALLALRKDFARNIKFPRIFNEDAFIYLTCKSCGYKFQHSSRAVIFYKLPLTLNDYLRQLFRSDTKAVGVELDKYFPGLAQKELRRPLPVYLKALLETFITNPVGTATMFFVRTVCYPLFPIITSKYKLSWFTAASTHEAPDFVGKDPDGNFSKRHSFSFPDSRCKFLLNEIRVLRHLNQYPDKFSCLIPQLLASDIQRHSVSLTESYYSAQPILDLPPESKVAHLTTALETLNSIPVFPHARRNNKILPAVFIFNLMISVAKFPKSIKLLAKPAVAFFWHYLLGQVWKNEYGLTHGELYSDSLLIDSKTRKLVIVDWEAAVLADRLTDLSDLPRLYLDELDRGKLEQLVDSKLKTAADKHKFLALTIFRAVQTLYGASTSSGLSQRSLRYLTDAYPGLESHLVKQRTLYELVHPSILDTVSVINSVFNINKFFKPPPLILCYHSVCDDGWRFSTPVKEFKNQLDYLKKNFKVVPVSGLLSSKMSGGIAITFDDGYKNVYRQAFPLLKKLGLQATVFVLGSPHNASRKEVSTDLPFLSQSQIKALYKNGWEIGYHTSTHQNLRNLSQRQLRTQIVDSKSQLQNKLGIPIDLFAYPKGIYNDKTVQTVKNGNYKAAFTVDGGGYLNSSPFLFNRVSIEGELTFSRFIATISPLGLITEKILMRILQLKYKLISKDLKLSL